MKDRKSLEVGYPLGEESPKRLKSKTGIRYEDIDLRALRRGAISSDDLSINGDTLRMQARVAKEAGYLQLASNFERAAELVDIPNKRLLEIYEALRPNHSTMAELLMISRELSQKYKAPENARFVREAAEAYRDSGLLRKSDVPRPDTRPR